jgi:serpin B
MKVMQSNVARDISPGASADDLGALVAGNSAFAFDFYQAVRGQSGNLFYSPHSLSVALAMTYAGARGSTAEQMAETLHYTLPQERLHPAFNALDLALTGRDSGEDGGDAPQPFQLNIANSLWGQQDYPFLPGFLDLLALNYGAGLRLVDFAAAPEPSRREINQWVEKQTQEKIKELVPEGGITPGTTLVLANAIYFKADWLYPFSPIRTRPESFYPLVGEPYDVPMMSTPQAVALPYYQGQGFQAVELPYVGNQVSMLVLVPDKGEFSRFEASLDAGQVQEILDGLEPRQVQLSMPKFRFETGYNLAETLAGMGMPEAFEPGAADFSRMDATHSLFISEVFHKAFVAVDEKGTEAAAATAVVMGRSAALEPGLELVIDRPFIFLIRDKGSDALLFVGRVLAPQAGG